jgi:pimeloyl-[acyl-carrier protein] methyl ester esterase
MFRNRDGVQLFYEAQGAGEPTLLFVHGWMMSHEVWREQAAFSKTNRVVTVGLRGFGKSDRPQGDYTLDVFADDLDFIIQELKLDKPVLIGWSMGASIALVYAAAHPERISKLVLVDGTPMLVAGRGFVEAIPPEAAQQLLGAMQGDFAGAARAFVEMMFPEPGADELKNWILGIAQQTTAAIALNSVGEAAGRDLRPLLSQIKNPTLIVFGEKDTVCLPGASRYMQSQIAGSELHEFPGKGHGPFLTDAQAFNERLRSFIAQ